MRNWVKGVAAVVVAIGGLTVGVAGVERAGAQPVSMITFLIPQGTSVAIGPSGDEVIIAGQPATFRQLPGCVNDTNFYPVQTGLVIDPGNGRPTRLPSGVIAVSQTTPISNGTKLTNLVPVPPSCTVNPGTPDAQTYDKYQGTVQ